MKPKYTDTHRFPHGYRRSVDTDITRTWARARDQLEKEKQKRADNVRELRHLGAKK